MLNCQKIDKNIATKDFRTGDIFLLKSKSGFLDSLIRFFSGSDYIHIALIIEMQGSWFVIETRASSGYGYQLVPLDWWLARNSEEDIYLGKMPEQNFSHATESTIYEIVMDSMESLRPYSLSWILKVYVLQVWFKVCRPQIDKLFNGAKPLICSTLIQEAWERAGIIEVGDYMTPGGIVELLGGEKNLVKYQQKASKNSPSFEPNTNHIRLVVNNA